MAIRTRLNCNGRPISIKLLEEPSLTIVATDVDGIATTQVVSGLDLDDGDDFVHKFLVPQRLASLSFQLSGRVYNQNRDERQTVTATHAISLNGIQRTDQIADFYLRQSPKGYRLLDAWAQRRTDFAIAGVCFGQGRTLRIAGVLQFGEQ